MNNNSISFIQLLIKLTLVLCLLSLATSKVKSNIKFTTTSKLFSKAGIFFNSTSNQGGLVDPQNYLTNFDDINYIYTTIDEFKRMKDIEISLILLKSLPHIGGSNTLFVDELAKVLSQNIDSINTNSLIIVIGVESKQGQVRFGNNLKKFIDDQFMNKLLTGIKYNLVIGDTSRACKILLENFKTKIFGSGSGMILTFFFILIFFSCMGSVCYYLIETPLSLNVDITVEQKLNKIKKLSEKHKSDIFEKCCVICLEEFEIVNTENLQDVSSYTISNLEIKDEKPLVNTFEETTQNYKFVKLECGHNFHSKCIVEWITKFTNCALCKFEKIQDENVFKSDEQKVVEIQTNILPSISNYDIIYAPRFTWIAQNVRIFDSYDVIGNYKEAMINTKVIKE
jgi:hypothetical protein